MRRHVYFYTFLPVGFPTAADLLAGDPGEWLPQPAHANGVGWHVQLQAEGALPGGLGQLFAGVEVDEPTRHPERLLRGLTWRALSAERLFPVLTADLGLDALDGHGCHLSLMGSYRPPLAAVGGAGDFLLGHRVAEACVRRFVLDVAARLERTVTV